MNKETEEKYISLQEATKYCNYSQEYLSLRVRQGKLKGIKFGRNWVTKKEWVIEYVESVGDNAKILKQQISQISRKERIAKSDEAPSNLPMGQFPEVIRDLFIQERPRFSDLKFLVLFLITCSVLSFGIYFEKESLGSVAYNLSIAAEKTVDKILGEREKVFIKNSLAKTNKIFAAVSNELRDKISNNPVLSKIFRVFDRVKFFAINSWNFVKNSVYSLAKNTKTLVHNFFEKMIAIRQKPKTEKKSIAQEEIKETNILESTNEGRVVVPSQGLDKEALKEKIKTSFSDEVEVKPEDDNSGVIIPIFKERKGGEYLYMLVPVKGKTQ